MWGLPGSGIEPVSPALAGRFFTPGPPGKPVVVSLSLATCLPNKLILIDPGSLSCFPRVSWITCPLAALAFVTLFCPFCVPDSVKHYLPSAEFTCLPPYLCWWCVPWLPTHCLTIAYNISYLRSEKHCWWFSLSTCILTILLDSIK